MKINNYSRSTIFYPQNKVSQSFGANQENKTSEINNKQQKSSFAFVALSLAITAGTAFKILDGVNSNKTFKDYCKHMKFSEWNDMAVLTSGLTLLACMAPDFLNKDKEQKDNKSKAEKSSFRTNVGAAAFAVMGTGLAISFLDIFINTSRLFGKKG